LRTSLATWSVLCFSSVVFLNKSSCYDFLELSLPSDAIEVLRSLTTE
jgi:hypothetical protein